MSETVNETHIEMLDIAIKAMNENELCSYCAFSGTQNCYAGRPDFVCETGLYEGLKTMAKRNVRKVS